MGAQIELVEKILEFAWFQTLEDKFFFKYKLLNLALGFQILGIAKCISPCLN
jgi:hypothetical protein